jgi:hypothetical protein
VRILLKNAASAGFPDQPNKFQQILRANEALSTQVNFRRLPAPRNASDF